MSEISTEYDIIIVGAGIHGAAVAQQASLRGLRVLLMEQYSSPAQATSSKSSKLLHGGLRYLESFQFGLVRECLVERRRLLQQYPDLVHLQRVFIPVYRSTQRSRYLIRTGLSLYALLGGMKRENRFRCLKKHEWSQLDGISTQHLRAVYEYKEAQTDDRQLTTRLVQEATQNGAKILFNTRYCRCEVRPESVEVRFMQGNYENSLRGRYLINAAGPWVNEIARTCYPGFQTPEISLVQGTHIEVDIPLYIGIYYLEVPQDRRAVFVMPWQGHTMIGTTEIIYNGNPALVSPTNGEIDYLLDAYNYYFSSTKRKLVTGDVIRSWAGLRVLPACNGDMFGQTRETMIHPNRLHSPNVFSIYGGKLTSHHATALKVLKRIHI